MVRVIFSHEMCSTSPHRRVVTASASSGGEKGRRQISKAWVWDLQANCWKTSALASVQSFLLIAVSALENTWWPAMEKLFEREERDAVGAQAQCSSQVTPQRCHNANSSLPNPAIFILYYLECLGSFFSFFLGAFPKAGGKCLSFQDQQQIGAK